MLELYSIVDKGIDLFSRAVQPKLKAETSFESDSKIIKALSTEVSKFIVTIESSELSVDTREDLTTLMRIEQYMLNCTLATERAADYLLQRQPLSLPLLDEELLNYFNRVLDFLTASRAVENNEEQRALLFAQMQVEHDRIKADLLLSGTQSKITIENMSASIDALAEALRIARQWNKGMRRLHALHIKSAVETTA